MPFKPKHHDYLTLNVGETVQVKFLPINERDTFVGQWTDLMKEQINKIGVIVFNQKIYGYSVVFDGSLCVHGFPSYCLEKVEQKCLNCSKVKDAFSNGYEQGCFFTEKNFEKIVAGLQTKIKKLEEEINSFKTLGSLDKKIVKAMVDHKDTVVSLLKNDKDYNEEILRLKKQKRGAEFISARLGVHVDYVRKVIANAKTV